jgi:predicted phosphodiesterase
LWPGGIIYGHAKLLLSYEKQLIDGFRRPTFAMKIQILSDIHNECFGKLFEPAQTDADVVVLAGDIGRAEHSFPWATEHFRGKRIVMVAGNHEAWGAEWHGLVKKMRTLGERHGVDFLENDTVLIDGVKFVGASLFTDFRLFGADRYMAALAEAMRVMPDFRRIRLAYAHPALKFFGLSRLMTPEDSASLHRQSLDYIRTCLDDPFDGPVVVVTHHAPSTQSVEKRYEHDPLSPCFASNLDQMIADSRIDLWVHGHTHATFDYLINGTRVVCNAVGYRDHCNGKSPEELHGFRPALVIEV